jgi:hypothetical protein
MKEIIEVRKTWSSTVIICATFCNPKLTIINNKAATNASVF